MRIKYIQYVLLSVLLSIFMGLSTAQSDEFTKSDLDLWQSEYEVVVKKGREVFTDPALGSNGVVCAQCHPNAVNTHPETYPKFQKQLGKVITIGEMINFCILNPLEGTALALDDPRMTAMQAYIADQRRDVKLAPGKH